MPRRVDWRKQNMGLGSRVTTRAKRVVRVVEPKAQSRVRDLPRVVMDHEGLRNCVGAREVGVDNVEMTMMVGQENGWDGNG